MAKQQEDNIDFMNLILMLNQNALIGLGEAPRFVGGMKKANLPNARQTINMIKSIQEKCTNLTTGESKLIFRILGDLQKKYVVAAGLMTEDGKPTRTPAGKPASSDPLNSSLDKLSDNQLANLLSELQKKTNAGD